MKDTKKILKQLMKTVFGKYSVPFSELDPMRFRIIQINFRKK